MGIAQMVLPRRVETEITDGEYGKFVVSPLERGYGNTIGSSLKRVLLSSLHGAAVTGVKINSGLQMYDDIPGVREDMAQLLLQLKQIHPSIAGKDQKTIRLQLEHDGSGSVHASEIICPPNVRIYNPDLYLFTAEEDTTVEIEMTIEQSKGYRSLEQNAATLPEGFVPVESNFSPVRRVLFEVESARVRQRTNYDKLIVEVWTDGTMTPQEALSKSSITLIRHLQVFDPEESADILKDPDNFRPPAPEPEPEVNPLYDVPIEVLDLSTRVFNSLRRTGITSVGDVVDMLERGEDAMLAIRNFGQTSLDELKEKLEDNSYLPEQIKLDD